LLVLSLPVFSGDITSGDITKFLACHDFAAWNFCRLQYRRTKDFHFEIGAGLICAEQEEVLSSGRRWRANGDLLSGV
jgi:hypothetical protein